MACPYYQKPASGNSIGNCNGGKVPSEAHQDCLCRSSSNIYANFCPIYTKLKRQGLHIHKWGILRRMIMRSHSKHVYKDESESANMVTRQDLSNVREDSLK